MKIFQKAILVVVTALILCLLYMNTSFLLRAYKVRTLIIQHNAYLSSADDVQGIRNLARLIDQSLAVKEFGYFLAETRVRGCAPMATLISIDCAFNREITSWVYGVDIHKRFDEGKGVRK